MKDKINKVLLTKEVQKKNGVSLACSLLDPCLFCCYLAAAFNRLCTQPLYRFRFSTPKKRHNDLTEGAFSHHWHCWGRTTISGDQLLIAGIGNNAQWGDISPLLKAFASYIGQEYTKKEYAKSEKLLDTVFTNELKDMTLWVTKV